MDWYRWLLIGFGVWLIVLGLAILFFKGAGREPDWYGDKRWGE